MWGVKRESLKWTSTKCEPVETIESKRTLRGHIAESRRRLAFGVWRVAVGSWQLAVGTPAGGLCQCYDRGALLRQPSARIGAIRAPIGPPPLAACAPRLPPPLGLRPRSRPPAAPRPAAPPLPSPLAVSERARVCVCVRASERVWVRASERWRALRSSGAPTGREWRSCRPRGGGAPPSTPTPTPTPSPIRRVSSTSSSSINSNSSRGARRWRPRPSRSPLWSSLQVSTVGPGPGPGGSPGRPTRPLAHSLNSLNSPTHRIFTRSLQSGWRKRSATRSRDCNTDDSCEWAANEWTATALPAAPKGTLLAPPTLASCLPLSRCVHVMKTAALYVYVYLFILLEEMLFDNLESISLRGWEFDRYAKMSLLIKIWVRFFNSSFRSVCRFMSWNCVDRNWNAKKKHPKSLIDTFVLPQKTCKSLVIVLARLDELNRPGSRVRIYKTATNVDFVHRFLCRSLQSYDRSLVVGCFSWFCKFRLNVYKPGF